MRLGSILGLAAALLITSKGSNIANEIFEALSEAAIQPYSSRSRWDRVLKQPLALERTAVKSLCLILSKLPTELLKDGRVQLLISELPLLNNPEWQVECALDVKHVPDIDLKRYMDFIRSLPIIVDSSLWHHALYAWQMLPGERSNILSLFHNLGYGKREEDLMGQFCAMERVHRDVKPQLIELLPVFADTVGEKILDEAKNALKEGKGLCNQRRGGFLSSVFKDVISQVKQPSMAKKLAEMTLPDNFFNSTFSGTLDTDDFVDLLHYFVISRRISDLYKLIDTFEMSERDIRFTDIIYAASMLVDNELPVGLFRLFLRRSEMQTAPMRQEYKLFLREVLIFARGNFASFNYYEWYVNLTLMEPELAGEREISIPLWDALLNLNVMDSGELKGLGRDASVEIIELILKESKCLTSQPLIRKSHCGLLNGLVEEKGERWKPVKLLRTGYWRTASLLINNKSSIYKYLGKSRMDVMSTAWALSRLERQAEILDVGLFKNLAKIVEDRAVKAYLALNEALVNVKPVDICRNGNKTTRRVSKDILAIVDREELELTSEEKKAIITALLCSISNLRPDDLDDVIPGDLPTNLLFNAMVDSYCYRWEGAVPGLTAE